MKTVIGRPLDDDSVRSTVDSGLGSEVLSGSHWISVLGFSIGPEGLFSVLGLAMTSSIWKEMRAYEKVKKK